MKAILRQPLSYLRFRQATWKFRPLPDFIVVGAQKSGTTSLFSYLGQHPDIVPSYVKEVHFFDGGLKPGVDSYRRGEAWYRANWPLKRTIGKHRKTFEASPLYLFNPLVPERMASLVPDVRMIAVLRDPVERAISQYFKVKRKGLEDLPVMEAMLAEERRLEPILEKGDYKHPSFVHHTYKGRGRYHEQLERFFRWFPKDRMLVLNSDDLFGNPHETLRRIFRFVGVNEDIGIPDVAPRNVASNRTEVEPEVYDYLNEYFEPHNRALYELIGENYGWGTPG